METCWAVLLVIIYLRTSNSYGIKSNWYLVAELLLILIISRILDYLPTLWA